MSPAMTEATFTPAEVEARARKLSPAQAAWLKGEVNGRGMMVNAVPTIAMAKALYRHGLVDYPSYRVVLTSLA